jgi:CBS domain-containing protein
MRCGTFIAKAKISCERLSMKTVADILADKETALFTIPPDASVYDAMALMAEKNIGALPVVENDKVIGMITERDYARKVALSGLSSKATTVGAIMTSPVLYVRTDQTSDDCMTLMTGIRSRHLPVMDGERLIGLVSIGDVMKCLISQQRTLMQELERHIGPAARRGSGLGRLARQ